MCPASFSFIFLSTLFMSMLYQVPGFKLMISLLWVFSLNPRPELQLQNFGQLFKWTVGTIQLLLIASLISLQLLRSAILTKVLQKALFIAANRIWYPNRAKKNFYRKIFKKVRSNRFFIFLVFVKKPTSLVKVCTKLTFRTAYFTLNATFQHCT